MEQWTCVHSRLSVRGSPNALTRSSLFDSRSLEFEPLSRIAANDNRGSYLRRATMWLLKTALVVLAVFIAGLIAYILVVSPGRVWVSANEAAAVGKLRDLNDFQRKYAAAHLEKGFACTLSLLKSAEPRNRTDHDMTSTQFGYNFAIINCRLDAKGRVIHYQATAVPIKQGTTGFRAFCTDDSGELWYDRKGSASQCLLSQHSLLSQ